MSEQTTPETEVASGYTEDQAASELLKRWGADESSTEVEQAEETPEPEAVEATTDTEDTEEETTEETGEDEFDVAGEKFKVPKAFADVAGRMVAKAKEVEAGATRKFQEAAELRKSVEAHAETLSRKMEVGKAQIDLLSDLRFVERRLAQYQQVNVAQLGQEDPAALTRLNAEFNQLIAARDNIRGALNKAETDLESLSKKDREAREAAIQEFAQKNIKGWGQEANVRLNEYISAKGIPREAILDALMKDERLLLVLEDAAYGARVRTAQPQRKPLPAQTLKPGGTAATKPSQVAKAEAATARLRKTGSVADAALALLARSNIRKR